MANLYVRSTDGSDSDNGSTWALAKATLLGAGAIDAAGDTIYVSQAHAEVSATAQTIVLAGTPSNPVKVVCANDAAEPPTAAATTATIATTGASNLVVQGSAYVYGLNLTCGNGGSFASMVICSFVGACEQHWDSCDLTLADTHPSSLFAVGSAAGGDSSKTRLTNCRIKLAVNPLVLNGHVHINGGSFMAGTTTPANGAFTVGNTSRDGIVLIENFDMSNMASTVNILSTPTGKAGKVVIRNPKLPAAWSGSLFAGAFTIPAYRAEMYYSLNGATASKVWIEDMHGKLRDEATIVQSGSVSGVSWKIETTANCSESLPFESGEIVIPVTSGLGASKTLTVEIVRDSVTNLTDAEVWVEASYLGTAGQGLGTLGRDKRATVLTTAADQDTSAVGWTTTGMANPNKQKLTLAFTPQVAGFIHAKVFVGKASSTVYVNPEATVA